MSTSAGCAVPVSQAAVEGTGKYLASPASYVWLSDSEVAAAAPVVSLHTYLQP